MLERHISLLCQLLSGGVNSEVGRRETKSVWEETEVIVYVLMPVRSRKCREEGGGREGGWMGGRERGREGREGKREGGRRVGGRERRREGERVRGEGEGGGGRGKLLML